MRPLRFAGCGAEGTAAKIISNNSEPKLPVLRPVFDWGVPPRTALLCPSCKPHVDRHRRRTRFVSESRPPLPGQKAALKLQRKGKYDEAK
jgi:hypothetical protein